MESVPRTVRAGQAAAFLAGTYFLARVIGLLQFTIINSTLTKDKSAAYFAAFQIPDIVNYLVAGGALSSTFIPIFNSLKQEGRERDAWRFFSAVATIMGTVLLVLIAGGIVLAGPLVRITNTGFTQPGKELTLHLTIAMARILLPAQLCFYLGGMIVGVLNSHKRFGATGFTGAAYNFVAIGVGLCLLHFIGPIGFAWGILVGALCGNFLLPLFAARTGPRAERIHFAPSFDWKNPHVRRFFMNALPIMLGVSLPVVDAIIVTWFASFLPVQAIPHLQTGYRFMLAPLSIVAQAASVAAFPYMASESAARKWTELAEFVRTGLRRLMFLSIPISTLLILIAQPLISLFSGWGKFTRVDVNETAVAFAFYCVGLFAWAGQQFVARGFYALEDTRTPTVIGTLLTFCFFIPLCWLASRLSGVPGLALATSVGAAAHFVCILIALETKLKGRRYGVTLRSEKIVGVLLGSLLASVAMGVFGLLAARSGAAFFSDDKLGDIMNIGFTSLVALLAFGGACELLDIPEWVWLKRRLPLRARSTSPGV